MRRAHTSTWLAGGVRAIDISDPANPVEVGRFLSPQERSRSLSDIALLGDDYVVASTVWWSGLYIFRDTANLPTSIEEAATVPQRYALSQNYPNPFNPETVIRYEVPAHSPVYLSTYNLMGQMVATLVDGDRAAGRYSAVWNGRNDDGKPVASGVYLYRIVADEFAQTRKLLLMR